VRSPLLTYLEAFNHCVSSDDYNVRNVNRLGEITDLEGDLAHSLMDCGSLTDADWKYVRTLVNLNLSAKLQGFCMRMAGLAVGTRQAGFLLAGLIALILDDDVLDPRDVYSLLAILNDASGRIAAPFERYCQLAARSATPLRSRLILEGFLAGPDYMKSLESMGVVFNGTGWDAHYEFRRS